MPLFEVDNDESLVPFRQLHGGGQLYEKEIEDLLWANADDFTGETLFRVARQPKLAGGGIPDIVALDRSARVVVIEVGKVPGARLTVDEREEIALSVATGRSFADIAVPPGPPV